MSEIALVGLTFGLLFVGWQQLKNSRDQVKLGLFEKRYKSYQATMEFLNIALTNQINSGDVDNFKLRTQDMPFLFEDSMNEYREEILNNVCKIKFIVTRQNDGNDDEGDADKLFKLNLWVGQQLTENECTMKFNKSLSFNKWNPNPEMIYLKNIFINLKSKID
ncbi:hypothetical protein ACWOQH_000698 [Vibrio parahaemolyticus]